MEATTEAEGRASPSLRGGEGATRLSVGVVDRVPPDFHPTVPGGAATPDALDEVLPWASRPSARDARAHRAEVFGRHDARDARDGEMRVRLTTTLVVAGAGGSE